MSIGKVTTVTVSLLTLTFHPGSRQCLLSGGIFGKGAVAGDKTRLPDFAIQYSEGRWSLKMNANGKVVPIILDGVAKTLDENGNLVAT